MNSIKKTKNTFIVESMDEDKIYSFNVAGGKLDIYDQDLVEKYFDKKFNKQYKEVLYNIMIINEDDGANESDGELVRNKIDEIKNTIINKYYKYIGKDRTNRYLKMLLLLEGKINVRERGKGR
jgi:hypothetical protein